jgi:hypothetical protein
MSGRGTAPFCRYFDMNVADANTPFPQPRPRIRPSTFDFRIELRTPTAGLEGWSVAEVVEVLDVEPGRQLRPAGNPPRFVP